MNYKDFVTSHSVSQDLLHNQDAKKVFNFLADPMVINNMLEFSKIKLPVLSGMAEILEINFGNSADFSLTNDTNRQTVGRMARYILNFFGYSPIKNVNSSEKRLRNFSNAKLFKTSAIYEKTHEPIAELVVTISFKDKEEK